MGGLSTHSNNAVNTNTRAATANLLFNVAVTISRTANEFVSPDGVEVGDLREVVDFDSLLPSEIRLREGG
jgi:hypothetical protein